MLNQPSAYKFGCCRVIVPMHVPDAMCAFSVRLPPFSVLPSRLRLEPRRLVPSQNPAELHCDMPGLERASYEPRSTQWLLLSCLGRTPVAVSRVCMYPSGQFQSEPSGSLRVTASCALRSMVDRIDLSRLKARCLLCNLWTSFHKPKLQQSISQARQLCISIFRPRMLSFSPLTCA